MCIRDSSGLELATACRSQRLRACDSLSRAAAATLGILTDTLQIDPGRSKPWKVPLTQVWWQLARPQLAPWPTATPNFSVAVGQPIGWIGLDGTWHRCHVSQRETFGQLALLDFRPLRNVRPPWPSARSERPLSARSSLVGFPSGIIR